MGETSGIGKNILVFFCYSSGIGIDIYRFPVSVLVSVSV